MSKRTGVAREGTDGSSKENYRAFSPPMKTNFDSNYGVLQNNTGKARRLGSIGCYGAVPCCTRDVSNIKSTNRKRPTVVGSPQLSSSCPAWGSGGSPDLLRERRFALRVVVTILHSISPGCLFLFGGQSREVKNSEPAETTATLTFGLRA